jgi:hypothetical protein
MYSNTTLFSFLRLYSDVFQLLEVITLLYAAWRWILIAETRRRKFLKKEINKVVLGYILSLDLITGYTQLDNWETFQYLSSMSTNDGGMYMWN